MFPRIVVQDEARRILDRFGVASREFEPGYYVARSVEAVSKLTSAACNAGVEFFNLIAVEGVMIHGDGLVINRSPVDMAGLHVDPLTVACTIDATGHDAAITRMVERKGGDPHVKGEGFMWTERAESPVRSSPASPSPVWRQTPSPGSAAWGRCAADAVAGKLGR